MIYVKSHISNYILYIDTRKSAFIIAPLLLYIANSKNIVINLNNQDKLITTFLLFIKLKIKSETTPLLSG